jgi:hypothetical protein
MPTPCPSGNCSVSNALLLAVEVSPISTNTNQLALPTQEIEKLTVDADNHFALTLERATTLDGRVIDEKTSQPVQAGIVLTRPSRISGRPGIYYQTITSMNGAWSTVVSPTHDGEIYTVRVQPDDSAQRPPETFLIEGSRDRTVDLALSDTGKLLQITGKVTNALQAPVAGMQVQALDPMTRVSVSTTAVTDATGSFALRLALAPTSLTGTGNAPSPLAAVQIVAAPSEKTTWQPRLELPVDVSRAGPANSLIVNLALPPLPNAAQLVYSVVGLSPSGKEVQVAGAHCQFTADVSDPRSQVRAYYDVGADTGADGKAGVMLIPATDANREYQVMVSPPSTSEFQAINTSVSVGPAGGYGASIMLAQRNQVTGQVFNPDGAPAKGVSVFPNPATAVLLAPTQSSVAPSRLPSTYTDAMGSFVLRVDNGGYDFGLIPPAVSGLPRDWIGGQMIGTDTTLPPVTLPPASKVVGNVADALNLPLVGASVWIYSVAPHNSQCAPADYACLQPPRLIAQGTADTDGNVNLLLPGGP